MNSTRLRTGTILTIGGYNFTIIKLGDVTGTGLIEAADFVMIRNHITGQLQLNELQRRAADTSRTGTIEAADFVRVRNHIMGIGHITL